MRSRSSRAWLLNREGQGRAEQAFSRSGEEEEEETYASPLRMRVPPILGLPAGLSSVQTLKVCRYVRTWSGV